MNKVCDCEKCGISLHHYKEVYGDCHSPEETEVYISIDGRVVCDNCANQIEEEMIQDCLEKIA